VTLLLRRADVLCRVPCECRGASSIRHEAAPLRLGGRGAAARHWPTLARALPASTSSTGLGSPRCCTSSSATAPRREYGNHRQAGPRLCIRLVRRRRRDDHQSECEMGELQSPVPTSAIMYWKQPRAVARHLPRRMDSLRRQIHRRRGGLLLTAAAADDMLKVAASTSRRSRSKAPLAEPRRRARSRRGRLAGRGRPDQAEASWCLSGGQSLRRRSCWRCRALQGQAPPYKFPRWDRIRTDLPKTATGKNSAVQAARRTRREVTPLPPRFWRGRVGEGALAANVVLAGARAPSRFASLAASPRHSPRRRAFALKRGI